MEPEIYYIERLANLQAVLKKLLQKKSVFGWLRFGNIVTIIIAFYLLWNLGIAYVIVAGVILSVVFVKLILADTDNKKAISNTKILIKINEDELTALTGNYSQFDDGLQHLPDTHLYANDLDIFGKNSLFQFINRTTSESGSYQLANYLTQPAAINEISQRQSAIKELSKKNEWLQAFQAEGKEKQIKISTKNRLQNWVDEKLIFSPFKPWKWLRYLLPIIIISVVTLYIFNKVSSGIFYSSLLIFAVIAYQINKIVAPIHNNLSNIAEELKVIAKSINLIEQELFETPLLQHLQSEFKLPNTTASKDIKQLYKIIDKLDLRYNLLLSAPLNILLLWNLQQVLDLEKWKVHHQNIINVWFTSIGNIEALLSLAILHFNQRAWAFPSIVPDYFFIEGKEVGHPLIVEKKRINNDIIIKNDGELMLITGSNMAGKSTYLRSIGVNVVLAMAGAPVCAKIFSVSHVQLISSMRITDNLAESTSTFYAELKKLKTIIEKVNKGEKVFILLDEILRGTNSLDRHTGSVALIKQLIKHNAAAIIATHDLELAKLTEDFPAKIINYHFDVQVSNDELFFDYVLKPGICTSLNASILMKKIGIEL